MNQKHLQSGELREQSQTRLLVPCPSPAQPSQRRHLLCAVPPIRGFQTVNRGVALVPPSNLPLLSEERHTATKRQRPDDSHRSGASSQKRPRRESEEDGPVRETKAEPSTLYESPVTGELKEQSQTRLLVPCPSPVQPSQRRHLLCAVPPIRGFQKANRGVALVPPPLASNLPLLSEERHTATKRRRRDDSHRSGASSQKRPRRESEEDEPVRETKAEPSTVTGQKVFFYTEREEPRAPPSQRQQFLCSPPLSGAERHTATKRPRCEEGERHGSGSDSKRTNHQKLPEEIPESSNTYDRPAKRFRKECLEDLYEVGPLLGAGGFGSVFAGTRKADGKAVALKYVFKLQTTNKLEIPGQGSLPLEVALMTLVNAEPPCSNIIQLYEWFDEPANYVMVLERPDQCQDLTDFCDDHGGSLPESLARKVLQQLVNALRHCKRRGVFHRDVKPANILIQKDTHDIKLLDFGCGDVLKSSVYERFSGTRKFAPPEWFEEGQYRAEPATVWSVGVTLYNMVCGSSPFKSCDDIIKGHVVFRKYLSPACRHLIRWCLSTEASERPDLEEIEQHAWMQCPGPAKHSAV